MTLVTLALALASAAIHATCNLWAKQVGPTARQAALMWPLTGISSVAYAPLAAWLYLHGDWRPSPLALGVTMASGAVHIVYFLLLLRGFRVGSTLCGSRGARRSAGDSRSCGDAVAITRCIVGRRPPCGVTVCM